ncbi:MAG: phage holin family protein [Clostridia bacterium]
MVDLGQIVSVPIIVSIVYFFITLYKSVVKDKSEIFFTMIPLIAGVLGAIVGIIAYYAVPEIMPAHNLLVAILIGGSSGLAATGTHQICKQIKKNGKHVDTKSSVEETNDIIGENDIDTKE